MEIDKIIYHTTREINNIEDKLSIATIFIFCYNLNSKKFSQLLYTKDHELFISELNNEFINYDVDFTIRLNDKNVRNCFFKTLNEVIKKYDDNGYYNALFNNDPFAIVIDEIVNHDFSIKNFIEEKKKISKQLKINFF